jgi:hypothetical protein
MLPLLEVEIDKLESDFLFVKNGAYTLSAGGAGNAVECQDHVCKVKLENVLRWRILLSNSCERGSFIIF